LIDQTATDYDDPAIYLPKLIEWAESAIERHSRAAIEQTNLGFASNAESYIGVAREYRAIAVWARCRLADLSDPDTADAPPAPLVDLTEWLKGRLGRHFPNMQPELWQALAAVLRPFRRQS